MDRNVVVQTTHFIQLSWVGGGTHRSMQHENILSLSNLRWPRPTLVFWILRGSTFWKPIIREFRVTWKSLLNTKNGLNGKKNRYIFMLHALMSTITYPAQLNKMGCLYHNIYIHFIDALTNQSYIHTRELLYITLEFWILRVYFKNLDTEITKLLKNWTEWKKNLYEKKLLLEKSEKR